MSIGNYNSLPATSYAQKGKDEVVTPESGKQLALGEVTLENGSGGPIDVGIGYKLPNGRWKAGSWTNASTTYTNDTTDAQSSTTNDFALTTTTNNDGFIVQAYEKFNLVGFTLTTAGNTASTLELSYWNGSAWTNITSSAKEVADNLTSTATPDKFICFLPPHDWALSSASAATGIDTAMYAIRVRATTAPTVTAALASVLWVGVLPAFKESLANNTQYSIDLDSTQLILPGGAGLLPYFGGTASASNMVACKYKSIG